MTKLYEVYNRLDLKNLIDLYDINQESWADGADYNGGIADPLSFVILEELFTMLGDRYEYSTIKYIKSLTDKKAYDWHIDSDNPNETNIETVALVYLPTCEQSQIEFEDGVYNPRAYDIVIFKKNVTHRAIGNTHGPLLKYTFYDNTRNT
jgi:hypothetical protein